VQYWSLIGSSWLVIAMVKTREAFLQPPRSTAKVELPGQPIPSHPIQRSVCVNAPLRFLHTRCGAAVQCNASGLKTAPRGTVRGVDPMGQGDMPPNMVMSPNILRLILSSNSNNCCLLYLMQILCVVSQKKLQLLGPPIGAPPLDPAGGLPSLRPSVFFYVPPIIL